MANIDELKAERISKMHALRAAGLDPYPAHTDRATSNLEFLNNFKEEAKTNNFTEETNASSVNSAEVKVIGGATEYILAGRVMNMRSFGALTFAKIDDGTATLQLVIEEEHSKESAEFVRSEERRVGKEC